MTYEDALLQIAHDDPNVVVMTAENRAAIRNIPAKLGKRFIDVGICEQTMVGAAAGLALRGRIPVVHALATFLTLRAYEFIRTDVGISGLPVKFIGAVPGFLSDANGPTHQALEDIAVMRQIPGMQVFCPADEQELVEMLPLIVHSHSPAYVRFNARPPRAVHTKEFAIGKAETLSSGHDVALLTYGFMLEQAILARGILEARGVTVRLVNMRSLKPVDEAAIIESVRTTSLLVTVEDHFRTGGLASIAAEVLLRHQSTCPSCAIALDERWFKPGLLNSVLAFEGFTGEHIAATILNALRSPSSWQTQSVSTPATLPSHARMSTTPARSA